MQASPSVKFRTLLLEFFTLVVIMLIIPFTMYLDLKILENQMTELSVTEFMQSALVMSTSVIFFVLSHKYVKSKGLFILMAGLFAAMFIRELDYYLDHLAVHLWKYLVFALFALVSYYSYIYKQSIYKPMLSFAGTKPFVYFLMGLLIVMAFSRVFGSGSIWQPIMDDQYSHIYKTAIQESLELFGYILLFYSSLLTYKQYRSNYIKVKKQPLDRQKAGLYADTH